MVSTLRLGGELSGVNLEFKKQVLEFKNLKMMSTYYHMKIGTIQKKIKFMFQPQRVEDLNIAYKIYTLP